MCSFRVSVKLRVLVIALLLAVMGTGLAETLLVTSDLHLTADRAAHEPALDALRAVDCDAALVLGDSTNNAHDEEHAYVLEFLQSLTRTAFVVPGNHDLAARFLQADFASLYRAYGWDASFSRDAASASYAVMTAGGTCLLMLDTNAVNSFGNVAALGGIDETTCAWITETLSALPEGTPVVACGHHPILPENRYTPTPGAEMLAETLRNGGVRLYLCGHDHGFAAVNVDGLQQITVGQPHAYPGWAGKLDVSQEGFHWQVFSLYAEDDPYWQRTAANSEKMARDIAVSMLKDTIYEGNEAAIQWFVTAFDGISTSSLTEEYCQQLLADPAADIWRRIETRTVVKRWLFGVLENCPQSAIDIWI